MTEFQKAENEKKARMEENSEPQDKSTDNPGQKDITKGPSNPKMPPSGNLEHAGQSDNTRSS